MFSINNAFGPDCVRSLAPTTANELPNNSVPTKGTESLALSIVAVRGRVHTAHVVQDGQREIGHSAIIHTDRVGVVIAGYRDIICQNLELRI